MKAILDRDFFDCVVVFALRVPPLRACREDLPELWRRVFDRAAHASHVIADGWEAYREHRELLDVRREHPLLGNFRDLQRAAFHLLAEVHPKSPTARCIDVVREALGPTVAAVPSSGDLRASLPPTLGLDLYLRDERQRRIDAAMSATDQNVSRTARLLGVKRETLRDWLLTKSRAA